MEFKKAFYELYVKVDYFKKMEFATKFIEIACNPKTEDADYKSLCKDLQKYIENEEREKAERDQQIQLRWIKESEQKMLEQSIKKKISETNLEDLKRKFDICRTAINNVFPFVGHLHVKDFNMALFRSKKHSFQDHIEQFEYINEIIAKTHYMYFNMCVENQLFNTQGIYPNDKTCISCKNCGKINQTKKFGSNHAGEMYKKYIQEHLEKVIVDFTTVNKNNVFTQCENCLHINVWAVSYDEFTLGKKALVRTFVEILDLQGVIEKYGTVTIVLEKYNCYVDDIVYRSKYLWGGYKHYGYFDFRTLTVKYHK